MSNVNAQVVTPVPPRSTAALGDQAAAAIVPGLNKLLADVFVLYLKTKNFHWHVSGPHFRDYHLLMEEQAAAILATVDLIAERARKLGGTTIRSIQQIASLRRLEENHEEFVRPQNMLEELREDNLRLAGFLRDLHEVCDEKGDLATASLIEDWIDQTEERAWFLYETTRAG